MDEGVSARSANRLTAAQLALQRILFGQEEALSDLLAYLFTRDPAVLRSWVGLGAPDDAPVVVRRERVVSGSGSTGRADLVVSHADAPVALIEVKVKADQHRDQFAAYLEWAASLGPVEPRLVLLALDPRPYDTPPGWLSCSLGALFEHAAAHTHDPVVREVSRDAIAVLEVLDRLLDARWGDLEADLERAVGRNLSLKLAAAAPAADAKTGIPKFQGVAGAQRAGQPLVEYQFCFAGTCWGVELRGLPGTLSHSERAHLRMTTWGCSVERARELVFGNPNAFLLSRWEEWLTERRDRWLAADELAEEPEWYFAKHNGFALPLAGHDDAALYRDADSRGTQFSVDVGRFKDHAARMSFLTEFAVEFSRRLRA
jgi:hypothetical protein